MIDWLPLHKGGVLANPMAPASLRLPNGFIVVTGPIVELRLYRDDDSVFHREWRERPANQFTEECALYDICIALRRMAG